MRGSTPPKDALGWGPWEQQNGEIVGYNELNVVNNLVNVVVAMAVANGLLQHPEQRQDGHSVSSDIGTFFRAQGSPVILELPLPVTSNSDSRVLKVANQTLNFDNDYRIRDLANRLGLHQGFGPTPFVEMLL